MTNREVPTRFKDALKLIALIQLTLETMDNLKGSKIYKQKIKMQMAALEKSLEKVIEEPLKSIDSANYELFNHIQNNIEMILTLDIHDLAQLKVLFEDEKQKTNEQHV